MLADAQSLSYQPAPLGTRDARATVAAELSRRGARVSAGRVVMTASSSESYSLLLKLLCDPGQSVLVPAPSYPLFDYLAALESVQTRPYRLDEHNGFALDITSVRHAIEPHTRAVVVVSPNNPTGTYLCRDELAELAELCREHQLAIIGDEVFADYPLGERPANAASVLDQDRALGFCLGGLSKSIGLPQLKLGWMALCGPDTLAHDALARLELICDTYLSVATPVQNALPALLERGAVVQAQIQARVRRNAHRLRGAAEAVPAITVLPARGGWYGVVRVPAVRPEEELVLELLERDHVLVHPGYFFDFAHGTFVVVSLLPRPEVFDRGVSRLLARLCE